MRMAIAHAKRGEGTASPNPCVGCVLVKDGVVIAASHTARGGRPHAETLALQQAGIDAKGATAYVTLEPCAHHGQTAPCAEALIAAGIIRCVIGCADPSDKVNGKGALMLQAAGIDVVLDVCALEAAELHKGFLSVCNRNRPWVRVKIASTLEGKIATDHGESQWITGASARDYGHRLRAQSDAILVGYHTAKMDDPRLGCRLAGLLGHSPIRVVMDYDGSLPYGLKLFQDQKTLPSWLVTERSITDHPASKQIVVTRTPADDFYTRALASLAENGVHNILVEGGGRLITALLQAGLVDEIIWCRAASLLGDEHRAAVGALGLTSLNQMIRLQACEHRQLGEDVVDHYRVVKR
jgi:diaminohydroxyphosphoribosylaminopyrimidine deaminase/5-amino-6-(5-phosphoribosylamino)uracil reductase